MLPDIRVYVLALSVTLACVSCRNEILPEALPEQTTGARYLLFMTHGSGDTADGWPGETAAQLEDVIPNREAWDIIAYDWSRYAGDRASASHSGQIIGAYIGDALASSAYRYEAIQFVAHSVGAFVIQAACDAYRAGQTGDTRIHLTFLDPFTGNGLIDWTYGTRRFGDGADFAEAYINTDDPVPSTNGRLRSAHNFDVTPRAPESLEGSAGHWWPVDFYRLTFDNDAGLFGYPLSLMATGTASPALQEQFPRGEETIVQ